MEDSSLLPLVFSVTLRSTWVFQTCLLNLFFLFLWTWILPFYFSSALTVMKFCNGMLCYESAFYFYIKLKDSCNLNTFLWFIPRIIFYFLVFFHFSIESLFSAIGLILQISYLFSPVFNLVDILLYFLEHSLNFTFHFLLINFYQQIFNLSFFSCMSILCSILFFIFFLFLFSSFLPHMLPLSPFLIVLLLFLYFMSDANMVILVCLLI